MLVEIIGRLESPRASISPESLIAVIRLLA